jgi:glutaminyl-peptide cyclotransferase
MRKNRFLFLLLFIPLIIIFLASWRFSHLNRQPTHFDGDRAFRDVIAQVAYGPRTPGSTAHAKAVSYIQDELRQAGWKANIQNTTWNDFSVENIVALRTEQTPQILLGAHYDSRLLADQDPNPRHTTPVPGANDGASGVAVLLELARTLPKNGVPITLAFFDAEDNGGLGGREWVMGSRAFVAKMTSYPRAVIIVDMVGDSNLNIYIEQNSTSFLVTEIWIQASKLGYGHQFIPTAKYSLIDDLTPFLEAGIPAVDIIDFDYPYWHTSADTPDKVSPKSLQIVGDTLLAWISTQRK